MTYSIEHEILVWKQPFISLIFIRLSIQCNSNVIFLSDVHFAAHAFLSSLIYEPFMAFKKSKTIILYLWGRFPYRLISLFITFGMCIGIQILMKYFSPDIERRDFSDFVLNENKITELIFIVFHAYIFCGIKSHWRYICCLCN